MVATCVGGGQRTVGRTRTSLGLAGSGPKKGRRAPKGPLLRLWWPWWAFFHPIEPQAGRAQAACPFGNRWRDFLREHEHLEAPSPHSLHRSVPLQRTEQQQHAHNPLQALLTAAANGQKSTKRAISCSVGSAVAVQVPCAAHPIPSPARSPPPPGHSRECGPSRHTGIRAQRTVFRVGHLRNRGSQYPTPVWTDQHVTTYILGGFAALARLSWPLVSLTTSSSKDT